ncbi:MAG: DUF3105 domain-containing protein [Myxococcota bacterium]
MRAWMTTLLLAMACELSPDTTCSEVATFVPNEGWLHVPDELPVLYRHNPPASGPHSGTWARWQLYTEPMPRRHWVHNLEHGGVVLLHRPDAPQDVIDALKAAYAAIPLDEKCEHTRALLTPDPELEVPVAAVAANHVLKADRLDAETVKRFVEVCRGRAPEDVCTQGQRE